MGGDSAEVISNSLYRSDSALSGICINYLYGILAGKTTIFDGLSAIELNPDRPTLSWNRTNTSQSTQYRGW